MFIYDTMLTWTKDDLTNEIKRLHQHINDDEITIQNKQNEINNLRCDYDNQQAVIAEKDNEINDLQDVVRANDSLIARQVNEINELKVKNENDHKNRQLRQEVATLRDYSDKQADVIKHYINQIKELNDDR